MRSNKHERTFNSLHALRELAADLEPLPETVERHHPDECACPQCFKKLENGWSRTLGVYEEAAKRAFLASIGQPLPRLAGPSSNTTDTIQTPPVTTREIKAAPSSPAAKPAKKPTKVGSIRPSAVPVSIDVLKL